MPDGIAFGKNHLTALLFVYAFLQVGLDMLDVSPGFSAIILGSSLFLVATELEKSPHRSAGRSRWS
ncbi:MAG: hypothetical protein J5X22_22050 [Candidatus Accumulibacter sp.]|uniref:hypothetical protein n=1 Tax=Accumulibacter sp. TaxID=2053492 RepID=UPI001B1E6A7D|nr:hypothetical protein [Accumulibacter sp.]MBO3713063.1 hypothetical protein [Accumulibacter sp.]